LKPRKKLTVRATADVGKATTFTVTARVDTPGDVELRGLLGAA
jgi:hypothetical protein